MKRTGLLLLCGAIVAGTILYVGAAAPTSSSGSSSEIEQLKKEVADLRQRMESLEQRWKDVLTPAAITEGRMRPDIINPYFGLRQVPQNWKRGEFNGIPYYIVPINETHASAGAAGKQSPSDKTPAAPETPNNTTKP